MTSEAASNELVFHLKNMLEDFRFRANIELSNSPGGNSINTDEIIRVLNDEVALLKRNRYPSCFSASEALKSTANAINLRNRGNQLFKKGSDYEALNLYTESVAFAEDESEELALAYANRSAVFFRLGEYMLSLLDINRATEKNKYPANVRPKLHDRKKLCLIELKKASRNQREPLQVVGNETNPIRVFNSHDDDIDWSEICGKFDNPLLPNASSKIKLKCDEKWGRYMVATEDIEPGEILSSQKFFLSMLDRKEQYKHCSCCFLKCSALIPCTTCSQMMYCSTDCRTQAFNSYHRTECKVLLLKKIESEVEFLALRMLLIGTEQGFRLKNLMEKMNVRDIFAEKINPENELFVDDYLSTLKLSRTFNRFDVKCFTRPAAQIIMVLQRLSFFEQNLCKHHEMQRENLSEAELFSAMLLINHCVSMVLNRFSIARMYYAHSMEEFCHDVIGSGICTLNNLINHSCNPNTSYFVRRGEHVIFTLRPIQKDEQIFISYCKAYEVAPIEERRERLSHFGFLCCCEACSNNWPLYDEMLLKKTEFSIKDKALAGLHLMNIMLPFSLKSAAELSNREIFRTIRQVCKWLHANTKAPSVDIFTCESLMQKCLQLWFDDFAREHINTARDEFFFKNILNDIVNHVFMSC